MRYLLYAISLLFILSSCEKEVKPNVKLDLPNRPNILWLVAEDLSPYIPSFGDSTIQTPNLSRLAAEGVCYDNFYSPSPVCAPSRAAIAMGMYPTKIAANHMRTGPWFAPDVPQAIMDRMKPYWPEGIPLYDAMPPEGSRMMSEYLRMAGYYCSNNAKEDYQFRRTLTSWDESSDKAHWSNRKAGQPFFAVFNFGVTHESQIWGKATDSLWVDENLDVPVPPYLPDTEIGQKDVRRMYSNIKEMDYQVGEILKQLEEDGELDNTIIVWYTDHGGPLPRQKRLLYDSGLKVPMIIRYPNQQLAGTRNDDLISFIDLAPTTLSIANIEPPKEMDGKAFLGKYERKEKAKYIYAAADRFDAVYDRNRAVRDKQFKYIRYYNPEKPMFLQVAYREQMAIMQELHRLKKEGKLTKAQALWFRETKPKEELFDTKNDPHEINNLADDPKYADKLKELRHQCEQWVNSFEDTGMMDEKDLIAKLWPNGQQPKVKEPIIENKDGIITISSPTKGALIGYQFINTENPVDSWSIYTEPFEVNGADSLKVVADRIGYLRSETVELRIEN